MNSNATGAAERRICTQVTSPQIDTPKHGLTGQFRVLACESQQVFNELRDALRAEHAPQTATELLLVDRLAEHVWLSQRAQRSQNEAASKGQDSWFALMLRLQVANDRGFHKCLAELRTLRRERQRCGKNFAPKNDGSQSTSQFESQSHPPEAMEAEPDLAPAAAATTFEHPVSQPADDVEWVSDPAVLALYRKYAPNMLSSNGKIARRPRG